MNKTVLEYLEGYFDGQLNESTSDEDIMEAFNELLETADAVAEYLNERGLMSIALGGMRNKIDLKKALKQRAVRKAIGSIGDGHPWNADTPSLRLSRRSLKRRGLKDTSEPKRAGLPTYMNEMGPKMAHGAGVRVQKTRNLLQGLKLKKGSFFSKKLDQAERVTKRIGKRERAAYEPNPMGPGLNQRAFNQGVRDVNYKDQGHEHLIGTEPGSGSQQMAMYKHARSLRRRNKDK